MSVNLRMVMLGSTVEATVLPEVVDHQLRVADLAAASKACLAVMAEQGTTRDRWGGGIVTDLYGKELGQVSFNGIVYDSSTDDDDLDPIYEPPTVRSAWKASRNQDVVAFEIPGHGHVTLTVSDPTTLELDSVHGFEVDGALSEYRADVDVGSDGVRVRIGSGEVRRPTTRIDADAPESLDAAADEALQEWLGEERNAERLKTAVGRYVLDEIDCAREGLADVDKAFEGRRREMLRGLLRFIEFKEGLERAVAPGAQPRM